MYIIGDRAAPESSYMALYAQLHITEAGRPDRIVTAHDIMTIGRDSDNDIVLESISVSRCHAVLVCKPAGLLLVDLESTNGTLVNGVPALPDEPIRLVGGDELQFGQVVVRCVVTKNMG
jgi:pSer/pThr/pTyr-binding forkhead associated (FHA) protein